MRLTSHIIPTTMSTMMSNVTRSITSSLLGDYSPMFSFVSTAESCPSKLFFVS